MWLESTLRLDKDDQLWCVCQCLLTQSVFRPEKRKGEGLYDESQKGEQGSNPPHGV